LGKAQGEEVTMTIPAENGFGDYNPDLVITDNIENVPVELRQLGAEVQMQNEAGEVRSFYVTKIEGDRLTVDGNHPLAGKTLQVKLKILQVRDASQEDMLQFGMPGQSQTVN
ncbi:MAG: peptidylprolyl isomerase, partial [Candidatus Thiodiazotropha taylori]|nr:peptidylprolyl isomerase [Candidatus Thiodiazotropha endolucinida]MCW4230664.1 peptidylprolyl isomerase [Candidatus Thiodiazotropha taylori]